MPSPTIGFRLQKDQYDKLASKAADRGMKPADWCREAALLALEGPPLISWADLTPEDRRLEFAKRGPAPEELLDLPKEPMTARIAWLDRNWPLEPRK